MIDSIRNNANMTYWANKAARASKEQVSAMEELRRVCTHPETIRGEYRTRVCVVCKQNMVVWDD